MRSIELGKDQKTIRIRDLQIEDPRTHQLLSREPEERTEQKLRDAITVGVLALDRTAAMSESDWVTQRLQAQIAAVNSALERSAHETLELVRCQFDSANGKSLLAPMTDLIQRTQKEIADRLAETVAAARESHAAFQSALDPARDGTILKEFLIRFDSLAKESASSPALQSRFDELRDEFRSAILSIKMGGEADEAIEGLRVEMTQASPLKGMVFEDEVKSELAHMAEIRNDIVESVGTQPGKGSSKKGDLIYYIGQVKARIVFELKDYASSKFTYEKIRTLMAESRANRDAIQGVFLVRDESCLPDGLGRFHIADDFVVATRDFLEVALKVSIIISHQKISRMGLGKGPDWQAIESQVRETQALADELVALESNCATATKAISKTSDGIRRVHRGLLEKVEIILAEATKAPSKGLSRQRVKSKERLR